MAIKRRAAIVGPRPRPRAGRLGNGPNGARKRPSPTGVFIGRHGFMISPVRKDQHRNPSFPAEHLLAGEEPSYGVRVYERERCGDRKEKNGLHFSPPVARGITRGPLARHPTKTRGIKSDSGASMGHLSGRGHGPAPNQSGDKTVARRGVRSSPLHGPGLVPQEEPARGAARGRAGTPARPVAGSRRPKGGAGPPLTRAGRSVTAPPGRSRGLEGNLPVRVFLAGSDD
jgi:hypothetical protein